MPKNKEKLKIVKLFLEIFFAKSLGHKDTKICTVNNINIPYKCSFIKMPLSYKNQNWKLSQHHHHHHHQQQQQLRQFHGLSFAADKKYSRKLSSDIVRQTCQKTKIDGRKRIKSIFGTFSLQHNEICGGRHHRKSGGKTQFDKSASIPQSSNPIYWLYSSIWSHFLQFPPPYVRIRSEHCNYCFATSSINICHRTWKWGPFRNLGQYIARCWYAKYGKKGKYTTHKYPVIRCHPTAGGSTMRSGFDLLRSISLLSRRQGWPGRLLCLSYFPSLWLSPEPTPRMRMVAATTSSWRLGSYHGTSPFTNFNRKET